MLPILLALTVLLESLFPLASMIHNAFGIWLPPSPLHYLSWLLAYGPVLFVAQYMLRSLNVSPFIDQLPRGRRLVKTGLWLYALYLLLALGGVVLSAIPYGGGSVPRVLGLLLVAVRAFLFFGLFVALVKELPAARAQAGSRSPET
jgi:hypothetical protein